MPSASRTARGGAAAGVAAMGGAEGVAGMAVGVAGTEGVSGHSASSEQGSLFNLSMLQCVSSFAGAAVLFCPEPSPPGASITMLHSIAAARCPASDMRA